MLFNSTVFLIFFVIFYLLYRLSHKSVRLQNLLLLIASYIFYGYWDWRFLSLIIISTLTDFFVGQKIGHTDDQTSTGPTRRKYWLAFSVIVNLSLLGFFKYFNFFADNFSYVLNAFWIQADPITLKIILPIGISFYTFQTMSYTIDVYRNRIKPTDNLLNFAVFVAFFPQLVAGPIERAKNLLHQFENERQVKIEHLSIGLYLILWGCFKKVVIADNIGTVSDFIFGNYFSYSGLDIVIGVLCFSIQIYSDFSGYTDIARGLAKLMGFELMLNFNLPYFAINPSDFWRRWHISLSTWLRDYLYISLGGNKKGDINTYRNLFITMFLGGLWHGAAWNFVVWGVYHGIILMIYRPFREKQPTNPKQLSHRFTKHDFATPVIVASKMSIMFILTLIGWLIFRSTSLQQITYMLTHASLFPSAQSSGFLFSLILFTTPLLIVQLYQYWTCDLLILTKLPIWGRIPIYTFMLIWIFIFGMHESKQFVYFQF